MSAPIDFEHWRIPFEDLLDADDCVTISYDAAPIAQPRIARGSVAPCVIPEIEAPRTITAELDFAQTDYESLEWSLEWEAC